MSRQKGEIKSPVRYSFYEIFVHSPALPFQQPSSEVPQEEFHDIGDLPEDGY
jgi:hypothetical protein